MNSILNGADSLLYNLNRNQQNLATSASRLSSGLRIQSAADDPSGLAVSESLRSRVGGLQQAVENVQTGNNLLTVADGAAATIQQILQRINSLIVESNSDINSDEQLSNIQTEIEALLKEVNTISSNANFNGLKLFDGSHDTYVANPQVRYSVTYESPGTAANGDVATQNVSSSQLPLPKLVQNFLEAPGQEIPGLFVFKTENYNATTQTYTIEADLYSTSSAFGNGSESIQSNPGLPVGTGPMTGLNYQMPNPIRSFTFDLNNVTAADIGNVADAVFVQLAKPSANGTALTINDGGNEGGTISISLPTLSTNALGISNITVLRPTQVDPFNTVVGVDSSNQWAAMDAQITVGNAIDSISALRAQIGSQMVSTQEDANNDNVNIVNLTASESSIRDLNVGSEVTSFTKEQILTQVGSSVLSQYEVDARQLSALMIQALVA